MENEKFLMDRLNEENGIDDKSVSLVNLQRLADQYTNLETEIAELEQKLKVKQASFRKVSEEDIPALMNDTGLSEIKLKDGRKIKVTEQLFTKIKDQSKFLEFLKSREEDDIIKLNIRFDRMEPSERRELEEVLSAWNYEAKDDIHYQTQQKYFRELLGASLKPEEYQKGLEEGRILPVQAVNEFAETHTSFKTKIK